MKFPIVNHMLINQQALSVKPNQNFAAYIKQALNKKQMYNEAIQLHASNVYLFNIPADGEITKLTSLHKKFIFSEEVSLYIEQFQIQLDFDEVAFDDLFELTWHGVVYHTQVANNQT